MVRTLSNVVTGFIFALVIGLTGCGSDGGVTPYVTYLPVTVGSTWKYINSDSSIRTETITARTNNQATREVVTATGKSIATEIITGNGFYLASRDTYDITGSYTATKTYSPSPGMLFLPASTTPGTHETQTVQIHTMPADTSASLTEDITVIDSETISVPAGTFVNSLKIQTVISNTTYLSWFALNVGMIRQDVNNTKMFELAEYSIK
jgi:hypothetical protein